jgi:hypothetical protein
MLEEIITTQEVDGLALPYHSGSCYYYDMNQSRQTLLGWNGFPNRHTVLVRLKHAVTPPEQFPLASLFLDPIALISTCKKS